jgi:hypothetical protein
VLFQDLGLLLTMFMGRLALGAAVTARVVRRRAPTRLLGAGIVLAFVLV